MVSFARNVLKKILLTYQDNVLHLFTSVAIETFGYCNRKCSWCFNSDDLPPRKAGEMTEQLYFKIINELSITKYAGRISPHLYGEPLMDKRIIKFISHARRKCQYAYLRFSSNGDLLTEEKLLNLINSGLDMICITNYDETKKDSLVELAQKYHSQMVYRDFKDVTAVNRAGQIFNKESSKRDEPCTRVSRQLVIDWKGDVLLCCNDYYAKHVLGNVRDKSIIEIWNCDHFKTYRETLRKRGGRAEIDICKNCDL